MSGHVDRPLLDRSSCLELSASRKLCEGVGAEIDAARGLLETQLAVLTKGEVQAYVSQTALAFLRHRASSLHRHVTVGIGGFPPESCSNRHRRRWARY